MVVFDKSRAFGVGRSTVGGGAFGASFGLENLFVAAGISDDNADEAGASD